MGQRLTLAVQGKMNVVKINGYDDDDELMMNGISPVKYSMLTTNKSQAFCVQ
jgi:hypothetical protein